MATADGASRLWIDGYVVTTPGSGAPWNADSYGMSDDITLLPRLAELVSVPTPPQSRFRAAFVAMFATNPLGVTSGYLQYLQDFSWPVTEQAVVPQAVALLIQRSEDLKWGWPAR